MVFESCHSFRTLHKWVTDYQLSARVLVDEIAGVTKLQMPKEMGMSSKVPVIYCTIPLVQERLQ